MQSRAETSNPTSQVPLAGGPDCEELNFQNPPVPKPSEDSSQNPSNYSNPQNLSIQNVSVRNPSLQHPSEKPSQKALQEEPVQRDRQRVVVIGAGIAGLVAAHRLQSTDRFDVVILEGSHRVGGRVYTSSFRGKRVEFGAQWIHGIKGSPVYKLAKEASLMEEEASLMEESESDEEEVDFDEMLADISVTRTESGGVIEKSLRREVGRFYRKLHEAAETEGTFRLGGVESVGEFLDQGFSEWLQGQEWEVGRQKVGDVASGGKVGDVTSSERVGDVASGEKVDDVASGEKVGVVASGEARNGRGNGTVTTEGRHVEQKGAENGDREKVSKKGEQSGSKESSSGNTGSTHALTQAPKKGGGPGVPDSVVSDVGSSADAAPKPEGDASSDSPQALRALKRAVFEMRKRLECNIAGTADLTMLSLQAYPDYWEFPGPQLQLFGGYSGVAEALSRKLSPETVRFGQEVQCIRWGSENDGRSIAGGPEAADRPMADGTENADRTIVGRIDDVIPMGEVLIGGLTRLSTSGDLEPREKGQEPEPSESRAELVSPENRAGPPIIVECRDGTTWQADHVIVTVSLGVLKERAAAAAPSDAWGHVSTGQDPDSEAPGNFDGPDRENIGGETAGSFAGNKNDSRTQGGATKAPGISLSVGKEGDESVEAGPRGLQPGTSLFDPPLPVEKQAAIRRMGFGVVDKVFVDFEKQPLPRGCGSLELAWTSDGSGLSEPAVPDWVRGLFSFGTPNSLPKSLMCWVHGRHALRMETLSPTELTRDVVSTLERFQGGRPVPASTDVARSDWGTDPLFRGSYSYVAVGSSEDDIHELARPLPYAKEEGVRDNEVTGEGAREAKEKDTGVKREGGVVGSKEEDVAESVVGSELRVLFAGEATHPHYYSTTHGAWLSGLREAERLLEMYNVEASDVGGLKSVAFGLSSIEEQLRQGKSKIL